MMSPSTNGPAIEVQAVSLNFHVAHSRPTTIKEAVIRRLRGGIPSELFWALREVSFEVGCGERLAIIGPNGSGKTSLLSLIAGVYEPDEGRIITRGRTVGLLGLGVGFDPEMSGRANIFLNASLFGLSRQQVTARLEDIIAFADIGDFIDAQVRTYSSGMVARLGFAVAAHIDAEILLLDEVLAVGDAQFRQKCAARLQRLRDQGNTLVLVSHDLHTVREMCHRAIWLEHGRVMESGPVAEVAKAYEDKYAPTP
jgi:ABC-type polysaccharide/polyol phosphate transport system ATPase subunit